MQWTYFTLDRHRSCFAISMCVKVRSKWGRKRKIVRVKTLSPRCIFPRRVHVAGPSTDTSSLCIRKHEARHCRAQVPCAKLRYVSNKRSETIYVISRELFLLALLIFSAFHLRCFLRLPLNSARLSLATIARASYVDHPLSLSLSSSLRIRSLSKSRFRERWTNRSRRSGHTTAPWYF